MFKSLKENRFDVFVWIICVVALVWFLHPILTGQLVAGWDSTSHFYLQTKMADFLKAVTITGYDANWFGGYPVFTFYGPLPYILITLFYFLSFGVIPLNFIFNGFLFLLPFFFLFSVYYTSRVWFGKKAGVFALLFSLFFLLADKDYAHFGVGLNAEIALGLFSSLFAIFLMTLLLGVFGKQREKKSKKLIIVGGILLAMIILTHALTTLFTGVLMAILFFSDRKSLWKPIILTFLSALILSAFWLFPFLWNLEFSSAQMIGVPPMSKDPLFVLYPGILLLIFSLFGITSLFKSKNHFWPYAFIATLIVLPRDYLVYVIDLPVHYYRFVPHIFVLNIFLAAAGLEHVMESYPIIAKRKYLRALIWVIVLISVSLAVFKFDMRNDRPFFFEEFESYDDSRQMLEYIASLNPTGRIAIEIKPENQDILGTPHFFSTLLPLKYDIPVLPGLLAESALSSEFILPTLVQVSDSIAWGNVSLLKDKNFKKQSFDSMIKRLKLYGVEYLLLNAEFARNLLKSVPDDELISQKITGSFHLLKLPDFKPLIEATSYAPFLFVDNGGMDFRTFSAQWFKFPEFFDYPVIYTEKSIDEISDYDLSRIGGFVISVPEGKSMSAEDLDDLKKLNGNIVLFDSTESPEDQLKIMSSIFQSDFDKSEIIAEVREDERLKFFSKTGAFINYSYFPRWKSTDSAQTVFWATPSMMFVFGRGETELFYD